MKTLYLDCGMGAAGDMLAAALYELLDEEEQKRFLALMDRILPEGICVSVRPETKCGILGTHFDVVINGEEEHSVDHSVHEHHHDHDHEHHHHDHDHEHHHHHEHHHGHAHYSMADVERIINGFTGLNENIRENITNVYKIIADAESVVHGVDVSEIHFHEVGTMDAIADVTAVCTLMDMMKPETVTVSPVKVGYGHVRCAHGILPVPAPATARILLGIPTYAGDIEAELCTPTGAALVRYFATGFGKQPMMKTEKIGYGMGTKDFKVCNCVRIMQGEEFSI